MLVVVCVAYLAAGEAVAAGGFDYFCVYFGGDKDDPTVGFCSYDIKAGWCYITGEPNPYASTVTHWMPLPDKPSKTNTHQANTAVLSNKSLNDRLENPPLSKLGSEAGEG